MNPGYATDADSPRQSSAVERIQYLAKERIEELSQAINACDDEGKRMAEQRALMAAEVHHLERILDASRGKESMPNPVSLPSAAYRP